MAKPIMAFKSNKELYDSLKEWQTRLFLSEWTICAKLVEPVVIPGLQGENELSFENNASVISIIIPGDDVINRVQRFCAEKVLVHELLHCKYNILEKDNTYESAYLDSRQHQLLEQMAKSLIMAKYNLPFDWFKN